MKIIMNFDPETDVNYFRVLNRYHPRREWLARDEVVLFFINSKDRYALVKCPRIMKWEPK